MNIQIFGTKKCSDTRKAERYFKERRIKYQMIDLREKDMSRGEFNSVKQAVGGIDSMINENAGGCKGKAGRLCLCTTSPSLLTQCHLP